RSDGLPGGVMHRGFRVLAVSAIVAAGGFVIHAASASPHAIDIQLQLARLLFDDGRYSESLDAYTKALGAAHAAPAREARGGVIQSALRIAESDVARREAAKLLQTDPRSAHTLTLVGDSLWASGLFEEAEAKYRDALALAPDLARGHHGMARSYMARSQL